MFEKTEKCKGDGPLPVLAIRMGVCSNRNFDALDKSILESTDILLLFVQAAKIRSKYSECKDIMNYIRYAHLISNTGFRT